MPGPKDDQFDEAVTTPLDAGEKTTPSAPPPASDTSSETRLRLDTPALLPLAQRYDLLQELGRGGMGVVYRARDRESGDIVALKVLQPEIAADPEVVERFKSELLLARKVTHKNVCRVHDINRFGNLAAISMEYVEGESLRSLLRRVDGLSVRHGLKILRQILAGLGEAHTQGVVHRDLKPENILIARDATVKVMDFGIARSDETGATRAGSVLGTPAYMSPEQAQGKPADARSDIYSLGLVLYEMCTGQPAFRADTALALATKQIHETPPAPRDLDPYLPAFLDRAIRKCLEKDAKKRFQSVAELEAALGEQPIPTAGPEAEPEPSPHLTVWRRADWVLLGLGLAGVIYFIAARDRVFPASKMRLEVEAIGARRTAEEMGRRLGRPFPEQTSVSLESRAEEYKSRIETWALGPAFGPKIVKRPELDAIWPQRLAVWRVEFTSAGDHLLAQSGPVPQRYAIVDAQGRVVEFVNKHVGGGVPAEYQPKTTEERRAIARQAAEQVCGPLAAEARLTENFGGERGSAYTAGWRKQLGAERGGVATVVHASLVAEQVVEIRCAMEVPTGTIFPEKLRKGFRELVWGLRAFLGGVILFYFVKGRCYHSPALLKRLPLAVVLGLVGGWVFLPGGETGVAPADAGVPPWAIHGVAAFAAAGFVLLALVTVEHYMRRRAPELISTYLKVMRGQVGEAAVALAVLRGVLLGLLLAGAETVMAHVNVWVGSNRGTGKLGDLLANFFLPFVDPTSVSRALESFSPGLYVASAALAYGAAVGLVILGAAWCGSPRKSNPEPPVRTLKFSQRDASGLMGLLTVPGGLGAMLPQPLSWYFYGAGEGLLLAWLMRRFDVLTMVVAVGTAVLWILNYPLLVILREVGNASHWAIFVGWGAFVLAAAAVAFRAPLLRALRQAAAE